MDFPPVVWQNDIMEKIERHLGKEHKYFDCTAYYSSRFACPRFLFLKLMPDLKEDNLILMI